MRRLLRLFYILFLILIWTLVLCLLLELGTRAVLRTANYFYQPMFERQNAKVYRTVKLTEELTILPSDDANYKQPSAPLNFSKQGEKQILSKGNYTCEKNYELTLEGVAEIYFDKEGHIIQSYGDPIIERHIHNLVQGLPINNPENSWETVLEVIKNPTKAPFHAELKYIGTYNHYYQIQITQEPERLVLIAKEKRDGYPLSLKTPYVSMKEDNSSWLVPFFAYKPHFERYNNFGFRDDDIILPKPEGVFRIVCIGGSTTEEGISNDMTYPNVMERKLKKYLNTEKIDVINAGIIGQRSFGELRRINDFLNLQPNMIVYYNAVNDICLVDIPIWLKLPNPYRKIITHSDLLTRIFNRKLLPSDDYIADYFRKTILRNLGAMNCACKKQSVQMAICSFAYPKIKWYEFVPKLYYDFNMRNSWVSLEDVMITFDTYKKIIQIYNRELNKFCERENILYIPVAEGFNWEVEHFTDICHMTPMGINIKTDIISSRIVKWMEENGWQ